MKKLLLLIALLPVARVSAQSKFVIDGKISAVTNGTVVINRMWPAGFYQYKISKDTVPVRNHAFTFTGMLKYPEQYRIMVMAKGKPDILTEPFFIGAGHYQMTINEAADPHDLSEVGVGVTWQNNPVNDEYTNKFLPPFNAVIKQYDQYYNAVQQCHKMTDKRKKAACVTDAEKLREELRSSLNSILSNYTKANPRSPILPWLLYAYEFYRGYYANHEEVLKQIAPYTPEGMKTTIRDFLVRQKQTAPGYPFALSNFVQSHLPKNLPPKRYILVDFWFSGCVPCKKQFNDLKKTYSKYSKKGLEIVAISVDTKETLSAYNKVLEKNKYPWLQVLDLGGIKAKTMDIHSFPSSFLLDNHWKIVKAHIDPDRLDSFLEDNLL